ncbi:MAG: methylmalonyl-CoA mutase, partial [Myxococcales bacterium]|nr:methylmalonyl-CoA mutase [Myxococcales bacterium]
TRFGARRDASCMLRFHTQTAGSTLTAQQIDNNIARVTLQALAAVLGGTQSLHTNGRDEALGLPTPEAARIALRTQQIIGYESGVADFVDPLAGSYAVELLTDELEARATAYIERIDQLGGMIAAIEQGFVQREIQDAAYRYQIDVEKGDAVVVGQNRFVETEKATVDILKVDPEEERAQVERVRAWRTRRPAGLVERERQGLIDTARGDGNLMARIVAAVEAGLTVGEICGALETVFRRYQEPIFL